MDRYPFGPWSVILAQAFILAVGRLKTFAC
jgi:hypothetical protein